LSSRYDDGAARSSTMADRWHRQVASSRTTEVAANGAQGGTSSFSR
jgi:hypothetical protein